MSPRRGRGLRRRTHRCMTILTVASINMTTHHHHHEQHTVTMATVTVTVTVTVTTTMTTVRHHY